MKEKIMPRFVFLGEIADRDDIEANTIKFRCNKCGHQWVSTVVNGGYVAEHEFNCRECKRNYREEHWEAGRDS